MISTGCKDLDNFLKYGNWINCVYGPAASGKTTLCLLATICMAEAGKKVFFVDTENGFDTERINQLALGKEKVLDNIFLVRANNFKEQCAAVEKLVKLKSVVSLVVIDTITMHYRKELQQKVDINPKMSKHLSNLAELCRNGVPVLVTSQVYSTMNDDIEPVGGSMLKNWSGCLIKLCHKNNERLFVLEKHPTLPLKKKIFFEIRNEGIFQL